MAKYTFLLKDVARALAVSESVVLRDIQSGELTGTKSGNQYVFTLRDLERYLGVKRAQALFGEPDTNREVVPEAKSPAGKVKLCAKCMRLRPITEFERDGSSPDWLSPVCKSCKRLAEGRVWPGQE